MRDFINVDKGNFAFPQPYLESTFNANYWHFGPSVEEGVTTTTFRNFCYDQKTMTFSFDLDAIP